MNAIVKLDAVLDAFEFVSSGNPMENSALLCRETGAIYYLSEFGDVDEELPDDYEDAVKYVALPHKNDLDLGKHLVLQFAEEMLPAEADTIYGFFKRKGAYANFRYLLEQRGALQQWYAFETERKSEALRNWCKENDIEFSTE